MVNIGHNQFYSYVKSHIHCDLQRTAMHVKVLENNLLLICCHLQDILVYDTIFELTKLTDTYIGIRLLYETVLHIKL